jgi:hypothetical protein
MGFFDKFKSKDKDIEYPMLDKTSPAAQFLDNIKKPLESFAAQVKDPLEIVPSEDTAYVFVGKPPKVFGLVWIQKDGVFNMKKVVAEKGIPMTEFQLLSDELRDAYIKNQETERYSASLGGKKIVVIPSENLAREVESVIKKIEK